MNRATLADDIEESINYKCSCSLLCPFELSPLTNCPQETLQCCLPSMTTMSWFVFCNMEEILVFCFPPFLYCRLSFYVGLKMIGSIFWWMLSSFNRCHPFVWDAMTDRIFAFWSPSNYVNVPMKLAISAYALLHFCPYYWINNLQCRWVWFLQFIGNSQNPQNLSFKSPCFSFSQDNIFLLVLNFWIFFY